MMIFEMFPYNPEKHTPRTGWDALSIEMALESNEKLFVDQNGEIWTVDRREYIGKVRREVTA